MIFVTKTSDVITLFGFDLINPSFSVCVCVSCRSALIHIKSPICWSHRCVCGGACAWGVGVCVCVYSLRRLCAYVSWGWIIEVFHLSGNQFVLEISRVHECWITHHNTVGLNYGKTSSENINKVSVCVSVCVCSLYVCEKLSGPRPDCIVKPSVLSLINI